jgi:hypothetical protein
VDIRTFSAMTDRAGAKTALHVYSPFTDTLQQRYKCPNAPNRRLREGRFTPKADGQHVSKNVYARARGGTLAELMKAMKAEMTAETAKQAQRKGQPHISA